MILVLLLALVLFAVAIAFAVSAAVEPGVRRAEHLEQIEAYGYSGATSEQPAKRPLREVLDSIAASLGDTLGRHMRNMREDELQRQLIGAGFYNVGPRRFLGYRVLLTIAIPVLLVWLGVIAGASSLLIVVMAVAGAAAGWLVPYYVVTRRARIRFEEVDRTLPDLIDLLVVTLEAGLGFTAALRMSADRLGGPLGDEVRLTIQEQSLGLSTLEALENWLTRCDTPFVRGFVRAMVQGDRLGVSIGQILRNLAVEMRLRRKAAVEEKAQKAPIKMLFPLVFLIFPALFVILLGPALFKIVDALNG